MILKDRAFELVEQEHSKPLFNLIQRNRKHLGQWFSWVDGVSSLEDVDGFIQRVTGQFEEGKGPHYAIFSKRELAGIAGFHPIDWPNRNAELGYWLGKEFTGQGLATAGCRFLLEKGFTDLGLNRIEIRCGSGNEKSIAVAGRLGMVYEGTLREEELLKNTYVDHRVYSILAREYNEQTREQR